jgi:NADP-dependent 3-hydroxy acid dehydrogenase YdfG
MPRVVVITGASSGIGAALAELLASRSDSVVLVARRREAVERVAKRCGTSAHAVVADMSRREDVRRVVREAVERFGHIDVWVNNVGRGISRSPTQLTDDDIDAMMTSNVKTALYGMQEVLPHFKERNAGHAINISSMLGRLPYALPRSAYTGSKHFLNALTANFRDEVRQTHPGIQFSIVSPPAIPTDFGMNALHGGIDSRKLPDTQSLAEVVQAIAWTIDTREPDVYTRPASRERVLAYFSSLGADAPPFR